MPEKTPIKVETVRRKRLAKLLQLLSQKGVTQTQVAKRAGIPTPYLTDMKRGRRPLTELFARRLAEQFGADYQWLLGATGTMDSLELDSAVATDESTNIWLPVFPYPIQGRPRSLPWWDGSCVAVAGAATARVRLATDPYVLRFGVDDHAGRLKKGDLLLISQSTDESAEFHVIRIRRGLYLARRSGVGLWERAAQKGPLKGDFEIAGHAMGIVWAAL